MKFGSKKGQAVMEYLITYGLALFVILIVLAILVSVVLPSLKPPETCQFTQPGFSCSTKQHVLVASADNKVSLLFQLDNQQGKGVNVIDVLCTVKPSGNIQKADVTAKGTAGKAMVAGSSITFGGVGADIAVPVNCLDDNGNALVLAPNSNFKGTLAVIYTYQDDIAGAPQRMATATLAGTVQSQ